MAERSARRRCHEGPVSEGSQAGAGVASTSGTDHFFTGSFETGPLSCHTDDMFRELVPGDPTPQDPTCCSAHNGTN